MRTFILVDQYDADANGNDAYQGFDTLEAMEKYLKEQAAEYSDDSYTFERWRNGLTAFEIVREIPVNVGRAVATVTLGNVTDIPAPLPGETVTDYAARITRG